MSKSPHSLPDRDAELRLHQRLFDESDPLATHDLMVAYFDHLVDWLERHNERYVWSLCEDAAERALAALMKNPASYNPEKYTLVKYLRMAAQGKLRNLIAGEKKHHAQRISMESVEHSDDDGKYLGEDNDPSLQLCRQEEDQAREQSFAAALGDMTEIEKRVFEMMREGVRKHEPFAIACAVTHLPLPQQKKVVKRVKDRLKVRGKRASEE